MPVVSLKILGGFEARRSSGEIAEIRIRKGQALLAFLALNRGEAVARSKLIGLLWSDRGDAQAKASLRQTLTVLRKALKPMQDQVLRTDRHSVGLDRAGVEVDAVTLRDLIASGTPADLETAVSLYRGDLLDGLDLPDPGFQSWLENERRRFHDLMVEALDALIVHKRADGAPQDTIVLARRLLTLEPLREDVHRALMSLYAELGQRHAGHRQYQRCRELLASELNVAPEAETQALYQSLRNNDEPGDDMAEVPGATVLGQPEIDDGGKASIDERSGRPPLAKTRAVRGSRRWAAALGRALVIGGMAAIVWLLPWAPSFEPLPPDRIAFQRLDVPSLAVPSFNELGSVPEGVTESSGPASLDRKAFSLPDRPSLAAWPFDNLMEVLERVTVYSTAQREADGLWPLLADSWDLRAVREFKTRYPEARQVAEADRRIAFLIQRHREAQAELNRLGYDAGPVDGAWGPSSARAMRAFQADYGLTRDGVVSEALLSRLRAATPRIATPADLMSEPEPQPGRREPEVAVLSRLAEDGIPDGSRWTASGDSRDGSRIVATATRRGDTLEVVLDIDHRPAAVNPTYANRYTRSCTDRVEDLVVECWIPSRIDAALGAKVFGSFPRLTYQASMVGNSSYTLPPDIVLDFRPESRLATE